MRDDERRERQAERWDEWRKTDFDILLKLYTRIVNDFAVSHFTMRDAEDEKELAMDSSFLLEQLRNRFYDRRESHLRLKL